MYSFLLLLCVFVVFLSPVLLDIFLNIEEARRERNARRRLQKNSPHLVWASPRLR